MQDDFFIDHRIQKTISAINEPYFLSNTDYLTAGNSSILEIPVTNLLFFLKKPGVFLPLPTPGNSKFMRLSTLSFLFTKTFGFVKKDIPVVILFHDFTFSGKKSLNYFRTFIDKCVNTKDIKFITLQELKKEYIK